MERRVFKPLWSLNVLPKAQILGLRVMVDKLAIKTKLVIKGIHLGNALCELCAESEESIIHLFFDRKISKTVWGMCDQWVGVNTMHHNKPCANFQHFHLMQLNEK